MRFSIKRIDRNLDRDVTVSVDADSREQATRTAISRGIIVSSVRPTEGDLDDTSAMYRTGGGQEWRAASQPGGPGHQGAPVQHRYVPVSDYGAIRRNAKVVAAGGFALIGIGLFVLFFGVFGLYVLRRAGWEALVAALPGLAVGAALVVNGALLRLAASVSLAIRDIARRS